MTTMKKLLFLIVFGFTFILNISAQNNTFKIFYSHGSAYLITGGDKKPVLRDMLLNEKQSLKINKNASVIIVAPNGISLPLSIPGTYSYQNLITLMVENSKSLTNSYFSYVVNEMTKPHEAKKDNIIGGVYRGDMFMHLPFDSCLIIQNNINFSWGKGYSPDPLTLAIWDDNGRIVFRKSFSDTIYNHEIRRENNDRSYEWTVGYDPDRLSNIVTRMYTIASQSTSDRLNKELVELKKNMSLSPEFNELLLLSFYDKNHLFIEEYSALKAAIIRYPVNTLIQDYYKWFLEKH